MEEGEDLLKERFDRLIGHYGKHIRTLCWNRSSGDPVRCAELVQECYVALWSHLPELHADLPSSRATVWMLWQCRGALTHYFRLHRPWLSFDAVADRVAVDEADSASSQLRELAASLPPRERRYVDLLLDGYSPAAIAHEMHISVDTLYKLRRRAIELMKENLKNNTL